MPGEMKKVQRQATTASSHPTLQSISKKTEASHGLSSAYGGNPLTERSLTTTKQWAEKLALSAFNLTTLVGGRLEAELS